jgi:hypothetical protein
MQAPRTAVQSALSKYFAQDFFTYVIPITESIAAGGTTDGNVTLDADSDFLWQKFTFLALDNSAAAIEQNLTKCGLIITDTGSGRNLSNSTVPLAAFAGSGELPFILPTPKIFKASGQIQVTVNNFGDTTLSSLYLVFIGQKCYLKAGM